MQPDRAWNSAPHAAAKRRAIGFAGVAILAVLGYMFVGLLQARQENRTHALRLAHNLSALLATHLQELFGVVASQLDLAADGVRDASSATEARAILRRSSFHSPIIAGMAVYDRSGRLLHTVGRRGPLLAVTDEPIDLGIKVEPVSPGDLLSLWKARFDRSGVRLGAIVAFIDVLELRRLIGSLNIGGMGSAAIWRNDAVLLVRSPHDPSAIGRTFPGGPAWTALHHGSTPTAATRISPIDGEGRMHAIARLANVPIAVSVGLSEGDHLISWWSRALETAVITLAVALIIALLGVTLLRRISAQEAAELALRASERRLSEALEGVRDAVWEWDLATGEFFLSSVWDRIVGRSEPRPIRAEALRALVHPADLAMVRARMRDHVQGHTDAFEATHRVRHASGDWIWVQVRGRAMRDEAGRVLRVVGTLSDVSERVSTEQRLAASEQRLRDIVTAMADWAWETDRTHRIVWMSDSVERVIGVAADWHIGKRWREFDIVAIDAKAREALEEAISSRRPFRDIEYARRTPRGVRWIQGSAVPKFDENGEFAGYRGTGRDVTDLRSAQRLLRDALETMPAGVVLFDADDRLVLSSEKNKSLLPGHPDLHREGVTFEEVIRLSVARGLLPDAMQDPERWIKARLDRHRAANGAILVHYEDRVLEVFEHRTHDGGCLMLRFDVTERERLGERLRQAKDAAEAANTAKSQFLANMSHELRTPLNAIIGFSQLLESELLGPLGNERYREYAGDIRDSGEHLLTIISDILDLSRVEAGRMVLEPVDTDIVELLRTGERWENERATLEGVELRLDVPERGLRWKVDPTRLKQAIVNLVSNAVKFTPRGGIVTLSAAEEGGRLVLRVTDTGVGMTAAQVHQALQPFGQVQNAMSRKHAGTGLGLPLTKALVELHGGTLEIDSRTGQGTVVEASIPARSAQKRQVSEAAA